MIFVTSMNNNILKSYGKRFLDEFDRHANNNLSLINIFEGDIPKDINSTYSKIKTIKLDCTQHQKFLNYFGQFYQAKGFKISHKIDSQTQKINFHIDRDYRFDAIRFSFKVFSINYCLKYIEGNDYLIWTDADLRCLRKFSQKDLMQFMPDSECLMSYLGRTFRLKPNDEAYSECGFLGFQINHSMFSSFINRMIEVYLSGEIFSFAQWHDSWVWDRVREEFEFKNVKFKNLSGIYENCEHPFINTNLGNYFDHLKGPKRKIDGKSKASDYKKKI